MMPLPDGARLLIILHHSILLLVCCSITLADVEGSDQPTSSSISDGHSRSIEVRAAGRPFQPGVLYDAVTDRVLSSFRLWREEDTSVGRRLQQSIVSDMHTSDSLEDKSKLLDISGELQVSILSGQFGVSGSAKYLNRQKSSSKHGSVALVISMTTDYEYYIFPTTRQTKSMLSEQALHDSTQATHLVIGVVYGGRAIFEFQLDDQEDSSRSEIQGRLQLALKKILYSVEGTASGKSDDAELKSLSSISCHFFGDFIVDNVPSTLGEAVEIMKRIPKLIKDARTPVTAILVPLKHFTAGTTAAERLAHKIDSDLVEGAVAHYDKLSKMELKARELHDDAKASGLHNLHKLMKNFQGIISRHKARIGNRIAKELPKIRETGKGASSLMDHLAWSSSCLHEFDTSDGASLLLRTAKDVLAITNVWLHQLNETGATLALKASAMTKLVAEQRECSLVILLPTLAVNPPYLGQLEDCFRGGASKSNASSLLAVSDAFSKNSTISMAKFMETQSVQKFDILSAAWADINSKQFSVGQKEIQSLERFLTINQDVLEGRVLVGMQDGPVHNSRSFVNGQPTPSNSHSDHQDEQQHRTQTLSVLQMKVYCPGETPSQFKIPEPPQNVKIDSCNVTDEGPICIAIRWDEPVAATTTSTAPNNEGTKHDAATGYLMRCRQAGPPKAAVTGSKADLNIFPWTEDIPIRLNVSLFQNPCICDNASDLSLSAADQRQQEFEFQIQTVTKSLGRSDWSNSIFHRIQVQDGSMADANQDVRLTKLMVVGGFDGSFLEHVEVIDLTSGKSLTCPVPPLRDGPLTNGAVGAFIGDGKAVICAGENARNKCYTYSNRTDTWDPMPGSLILSLFHRAAVVLPDGRWWLTGGYNDSTSNQQTEMLVFNGQGEIRSQAFVPLPRPAHCHHMLLLNESAVVFVGGSTELTDLWLFNIDTSKWTQLPSMPRAKEYLVAGLARFGHDGNSNNKQQQQLVVTGGWDNAGDTSTLIFDFDANKWRNGRNNFPHEIYLAASVQYQDSFVVIGGFIDKKGQSLDTIFQFHAKNENWVQTSKKLLRGGKREVAAFLVPDSYVVQQYATS